MERLSSGLRINRASDDAAGLAISEKMRGQIRGLEKAQRNVQDGVSMIGTAESALSEVHEYLQRARELAIQAGNDTLTEQDRMVIQEEVRQIKSGINEIANETHFNGIHLLNVPDGFYHYGGTSNGSSGSAGTPGSTLSRDEFFDNLPGNILSSVTMTDEKGFFRFQTDNGYPDVGFEDNLQELAAFSRDSTDSDGYSNPLVRINGEYRSVRSTITNVVKADNFDQIEYKLIGFDNQGNTSYELAVTQTVQVVGDKYEIKYDFKNKGTQAIQTGFKFNLDLTVGQETAPQLLYPDEYENLTYDKVYTQSDMPDSFRALGYDGRAGVFKDIYAEAIVKSTDYYEIIEEPDRMVVANQLKLHNTYEFDPDSVWESNPNLVSNNGMALWWDDRNIGVGESFSVNLYWGLATPPSYKSIEGGGSNTPSIDPPSDGEITNSILNKGGLILQVGPNTGNHFFVDLSDVRVERMGLAELDLTTKVGADRALDKLDIAIQNVSKERSKYGAYENALNHIVNNLANYHSNISHAESRVRDTDMAKELMNQTKHSILAQYAQAMIAQSNQIPQRVLQLLR